MAHKALSIKEGAASATRERLVIATLEAWERHGNAGTSARALAQSAGLPVSAIYYHFGDLDHLYDAANRAALARAERWCDMQLEALGGLGGMPPEALPGLMSALIDDWAHTHRQLAFAWRECQLMAAREPFHEPARASWATMWRAFWRRACALCGLEADPELSFAFFNGESFLHLLQWRRLVDRACLDETCLGWSRWLSGQLAPEGPWRAAARGEAMRASPGPQKLFGVADRIAGAAAEIVAYEGVARLTHRAVAARAGITLGVVSHNFRTSADLLNAAFETVYQRLVTPVTEEMLSVGDRDAEALRASMKETSSEQLGWMLALEELMLAVARDPARRNFAAQLRYLRGRTGGRVLATLLGHPALSPLDAALFSSFSLGLQRTAAARNAEGVSSDASLDALLALFCDHVANA